MNRITRVDVAATMRVAEEMYPENLRRFLRYDLFTSDPMFAGYDCGGSATGGRSLSNTAHVKYPDRAPDKRMTVVIPEKYIGIAYSVHELAHVLHHNINFDVIVHPVTRYAEENYWEAFAEFVTAWLIPGYLRHDPRGVNWIQPQQFAIQALESL